MILEGGGRYSVTAHGSWQDGSDAPTGPAGRPPNQEALVKHLARFRRRKADAHYMELIAVPNFDSGRRIPGDECFARGSDGAQENRDVSVSSGIGQAAARRVGPRDRRRQVERQDRVEMVRSVARVCTHLHCRLPRGAKSGSVWKTCGQDDELAERISSALEKQYWRALDRSPSPLEATRGQVAPLLHG